MAEQPSTTHSDLSRDHHNEDGVDRWAADRLAASDLAGKGEPG